uniref:Ribonuclease H-like domain-containing protein n=1 Tax=Tanacetum cinerariifolium TaxID=118510 RepID=A0A6L2N6X4_TANCI|nr:ribonuclease H-like domain-containing protein [Tanacetum cinerariifolium]
MTTDNLSLTPALTLSDKLMAMNHLTTFVSKKLDVDAINYSSWVYYFSHLCHGYGILDHLVDPVASLSTETPTDLPHKDVEWTKIDFIIRSWIFSTLAPSLRKHLVDLNPTIAKDTWTYIAEKVNNPCWSFAKGSCWFGDACKYLHNGVHDKSTLLPRTSGSFSRLYGGPIWEWMGYSYGGSVSDGVTTPGGLLSTAGGSDAFWSTTGGQSPSMPFHPSQLFAGSQGWGQATLFPNAFNTTTLQDLASNNWNMDTVGDGHFILVTNSGHNVLSTPFRPLHLNNVLITLNIVKNMISFDFITRRVLLRCDSMGDLYPVTNPSTIPHAFLTSQYTWHQRLGHPGSEVLRRLVSSDYISCYKEKLPICGPQAEYRGVANAVAETCWIWNLLCELHTPLSSATIVYCDNVRVLHVPSRFQYADIFTKGLPSALFDEFHDSLSVRCTAAPTTGKY